MRLAALLVAAVLGAGVLWLAGEEHRRNCVSSVRTACSVLPWESGERVSLAPLPAVRPQNMNRLACLRYNAGLRQAGELESRLLDCSLSPER